MEESLFLTKVPEAHVVARLRLSPGNEIDSGKLTSPESSSLLAINALGWFIERPEALMTLPGTEAAGPAVRVEVEYCARFPWAGGKHPWLDAAVFTATRLIGVESKRFEPYREREKKSFSDAFDRDVWGDRMQRFHAVRAALQSGALRYRHLDAVQLVKHACGLVTEGRRLGLSPILFYLFAEPADWAGRKIPEEDKKRHGVEIADFAARVAGDEVLFAFSSYRDWFLRASGRAVWHTAAVSGGFLP